MTATSVPGRAEADAGAWLLSPCLARRIGNSTVPEFDSSYREARRAAFGQSVARLQQASGAAVTTLLKVMVDPTTPASTKVRAADSVLNHTAKAIELDDVEARLTELERANEASKEMKKAK